MLGFWQRSYLPGIHFIVMTLLNLFGWRQKCMSLVTVILAKDSLKGCELLFSGCAHLSLLNCEPEKPNKKHHTEIISTISVLWCQKWVVAKGEETGEADDVFSLFIWLHQIAVVALGIFRLCCGMWGLVLQPGIQPGPPVLRVPSVSHGTTSNFPGCSYSVTGLVSPACAQSLYRARLSETPWTVAHQAPLSMGFPRQEYWSGLPFPTEGDLPDPGIEPASLLFSAPADGFFTLHRMGSPSGPIQGDLPWEPGRRVSPAALRWDGDVLPAFVVWQEGFRRITPRYWEFL